MFRITRGHHVQHIHFPLPFIRDLDGAEEETDDPDPAQPAPAAAERERAPDASAQAPE